MNIKNINKKYEDNDKFIILLRMFNNNELIYKVENKEIVEMYKEYLKNNDYLEDIMDYYYDNGGI